MIDLAAANPPLRIVVGGGGVGKTTLAAAMGLESARGGVDTLVMTFDPSLRLKEEGRHLLRLLQQNATADWRNMTAAVPPHCGALVGSLARQYAAAWLEFAQRLDHRNRVFPGRTMG